MDVKIFPTTFNGHLNMVGSKSLSHRYLIGAALSNEPSTLTNLMDSLDIKATKEILESMGAALSHDHVHGPLKTLPKTVLNAHASGSTLRFTIPLAMTFDEPVIFDGKDRLPKRSLEAFQDVFLSKGLTFNPLKKPNWLPLEVKGPIQPGDYFIKGNISSQFVSGLLWVLPFLEGDSRILLDKNMASISYIQMTLDVLKDFNVQTTFTDDIIWVPGSQKVTPLIKTIEGDYSHSVFFLSGALLGGAITLNHLPEKSLQGDQKVVAFLKSMGAFIQRKNDSITVKNQSLKGSMFDLDDTPDLAPMLIALSAFVDGKSVFKGLSRLKHKESDRLTEMKKILTQLAVSFKGDDQTLEVFGKNTLFEAKSAFDAANDHRIAMTLAMLAPKAKTPFIIQGFECIDKSYPTFLNDYLALGGKYEILEETV